MELPQGALMWCYSEEDNNKQTGMALRQGVPLLDGEDVNLDPLLHSACICIRENAR